MFHTKTMYTLTDEKLYSDLDQLKIIFFLLLIDSCFQHQDNL